MGARADLAWMDLLVPALLEERKYALLRADVADGLLSSTEYAAQANELRPRVWPGELVDNVYKLWLLAPTITPEVCANVFQVSLSDATAALTRAASSEFGILVVHRALCNLRETAKERTERFDTPNRVEAELEVLAERTIQLEAKLHGLQASELAVNRGNDDQPRYESLEDLTCTVRQKTAAYNVVRAMLYRFPHLKEPEFAMQIGNICIDWSDTLTWIVQDPMMPWPGVKVRAYGTLKEELTGTPRSFRQATSLLDHAAQYLEAP